MVKRAKRKTRKATRGRRTKLTAERRKALCDGIKLGLTYKLAAQYAGIAEQTFYNWMKRGRTGDGATFVSFFREVKAAEAKHAALAMSNIVKASRDSWQAGAWLLERRHGFTKIGSASTQRDDDILDGITDADKVTRLRCQLVEVREGNRVAFAAGSFQAAIAGKRLERDLIEDLVLSMSADDADIEDLDSPAFREQLSEAMAEWPDALLEMAVGVYEQRHSVTLLRTFDGGLAG
jgi:hypothetical protein